MNKSFYITTTSVFLILFVLCSTFAFNAGEGLTMSGAEQFSPSMQQGALNKLSGFFVLLLSGGFSDVNLSLKVSAVINLIYNMGCMIISAYLMFLVMKKSITKELACTMSLLYLSMTYHNAAIGLGGPFCTLLSAFLVYMYYLKYDGMSKWYIMQLTLAILTLHCGSFIVALYLFPVFSYSRIKRQKTAWAGFVNMMLLFACALILHFGFINNFPVDLTLGFLHGLDGIRKLITPIYFGHFALICIILAMFVFSLIGLLYCKKLIKGYVKFSAIYVILLALAVAYFGIDFEMLIAFLPPVFISFAIVLCHLKAFRENKMVATIIITIITAALFIFI